MTTQSIVVYTPIENALYNGGMMIPLIGGLGAGLILFILLIKLAERVLGYRRMTEWIMGSIAVVSLIVAFLVFNALIL